MKRNIVLSLSLVLLLAACGIPRKAEIPAPDPYVHLTSSLLLDQCGDPVENYMAPVFGEFYVIQRYNNCGGVDDLFAVQFTPEISELQTTVAQLLVILYIRYDGGLRYEHLRTYKSIDENTHAVFYRLIKQAAPALPADNPDVTN